MHAQTTVTPAQLPDVLLNVAVVRPVFLWGAPGIGKSSLVRQFAESLRLGRSLVLLPELPGDDEATLTRRCRGTRSSRGGSTSTSAAQSRSGRTRGPRAASPRRRTSRVRASYGRRSWRGSSRSGSCWTRPGRWTPSDIAGDVNVRGRGGTVLQPGVDLLARAPDFPADGSILVITDARCDRVRVRREHAFLVPAGARLPFVAKGPVFRVS